MLMLNYWISYAAPVDELTGRVTGIGVAEGVAVGEVPPPLPGFFWTTAWTTWPNTSVR